MRLEIEIVNSVAAIAIAVTVFLLGGIVLSRKSNNGK